MPGLTRVCKYGKECMFGKKGLAVDMHAEPNPNKEGQFTYWHHQCFETKKAEDARKEPDILELSALVEVIKDIHDVVIIDKYIYTQLWDLRNGTLRANGVTAPAKLAGVPFNVITEAYELSRKSIQYAKAHKNFKSENQEMIYGLQIVKGNINNVVSRRKKKKHQENMAKMKENNNVEQQQNAPYRRDEIAYRPKKSKLDISSYLDE